MADEKKPATTTPPKAPTPTTPAPTTAASIPFDQFTESTLGAVMRAAAAQNLSHIPIVIGIIFHPGLGGFGGYGGTQPTCGFAATIKPFFTSCYHDHMLAQGLDLWDAATVQANWSEINSIVSSGQMPAPGCPGTWDQTAFLAAFQCWKNEGFPP